MTTSPDSSLTTLAEELEYASEYIWSLCTHEEAQALSLAQRLRVEAKNLYLEVANLRADVEVFKAQRDAARQAEDAARKKAEDSRAAWAEENSERCQMKGERDHARSALRTLASEVARWSTPLTATVYALHTDVVDYLRNIAKQRRCHGDLAFLAVARDLELVANELELRCPQTDLGPVPISIEETVADLTRLLSSAVDLPHADRVLISKAACEAGYDSETAWRFFAATETNSRDPDALKSWLSRSQADRAEEMLVRFGGFDGGHHKAWTIDQALRSLMGPARYLDARKEWEASGYEHDEGCAP